MQDRRLEYSINTTIEHEYAEDVTDLSARFYDSASAFSGADVVFPKGYSQIPRVLARGLDIRLATIVSSVEYNTSSVKVSTNAGIFEATDAIITVPLGVLKRGVIRFNPALPITKTRAITSIGFGVLDKAILRFPRNFWHETQAEVLGFIGENRGQWAESFDLSKITGEAVLVMFNAGSSAQNFATQTESAVIASAAKTLRQMFGNGIPDPSGAILTRWGNDPFAFGSYSSLRQGSSPTDIAALAAPVGRLHFAGEATSAEHTATVHGALISGQRAADEIR